MQRVYIIQRLVSHVVCRCPGAWQLSHGKSSARCLPGKMSRPSVRRSVGPLVLSCSAISCSAGPATRSSYVKRSSRGALVGKLFVYPLALWPSGSVPSSLTRRLDNAVADYNGHLRPASTSPIHVVSAYSHCHSPYPLHRTIQSTVLGCRVILTSFILLRHFRNELSNV